MGYVFLTIYYAILLAVLAVGLVLIVGSLMNCPALVEVDGDLNIIYRLFEKLCPICTKFFHILVGVVFSALAILAMLYSHALLGH